MRSVIWYLLLIIVAVALIGIPASAQDQVNASAQIQEPAVVHIGLFVVDFNRYNVAEGTVETNFYLHLRSDSPVSIDDFEIMNGQITTIDTIRDTPNEKNYRIYAIITTDPNLLHYPFDNHTIPIIIEPKVLSDQSEVMVIDRDSTGLDTDADLLGWTFTDTWHSITNKSYEENGTPYSRAVFSYGIRRDSASTILKFFLPILLIIIVTLSSLMMKTTSRLGLNASMFLAAVMIHWRIADAIPLVGYVTFLDFFMIITYATLVMVLVSGILIMKFAEIKDLIRVEQVYHWSIRIIPGISIGLYVLLFLTLMIPA
ncbi:ligand-gated ion channel [Methanosphaerula palustris]|uniref:Neurotransmitter-gated ion-channel ligand-binding domain-containing protein n=1 Tax=Methanosphaerula palustris (strain ATCC BAA-1556 / DSM 19958 / E1-9c) TaxID=521011 RepID=B8GI27_METPE|nr:hypothetical protein [Methanosphaerula palustris]ACL16767.1 conserved hypothetical protein [Methanosphaerula palustris E1-9c]